MSKQVWTIVKYILMWVGFIAVVIMLCSLPDPWYK